MAFEEAYLADEDHNADGVLMAEVRGGNREALAELYDRHSSAMYRLACRILSEPSDAEDLVHDVFVEAWKKAHTWSSSRGNVRSWLMIRVRSRAIDRVRSRGVARKFAQGERAAAATCPSASSSWDPSMQADQYRARSALAGLSAPQRSVIDLAYFQGLSCSEIAKHCDMPIGTVKSRMAAGLRALREAFDAGERDANVTS